ncbi:hypothetical protein [Amycolatopsis samaneae]|uniref:Uncharacterized protein n=1 Tax=Amycolatopsis samaneae TaxID=664691 RepID=A0ABW5GLP9_9PSEU
MVSVTGKGLDGLEIAARAMVEQQLQRQLADEAARRRREQDERDGSGEVERPS